MKHYGQGDQCTFVPDTEEARNLEEFAKLLTENSPTKNVYRVKDVYLDMGLDWKWTTIINETRGYQALSPMQWFNIVNRDISYSDLVKEFFADEYCPDKAGN